MANTQRAHNGTVGVVFPDNKCPGATFGKQIAAQYLFVTEPIARM